jgi:hypothetical protein
MKTVLTTSRKWSNPQIESFVSSEEVGASIEIDAFLDALVESIGNPTLLVTKAKLREKLGAATQEVLKELRDSTKFVV